MQQLIHIVLASASPRRKQLLQQMGLDFSVQVFPVDESSPEQDPINIVTAIVKQKIDAALCHLPKDTLKKSCVLCADTVVVIENEVLGKANGKSEAKAMLQKLSGKKHVVVTAFGLHRYQQKIYQQHVSTEVEFMPLTNTMIEQYLQHDEYKDKAGAYAIQGLAGCFVQELKGSYSSVIGLPQAQVFQALEKLNVIQF